MLGRLHISENSRQGVIIARGDGVELMIVTAGATERLAEKPFADGVELFVDDIHAELVLVLFFVIEVSEDEVSGGSAIAVSLFDGSGGKEIASYLFGNELIEGQVAIVGIDHVVAIALGMVENEAATRDGFGEPGDVEPVAAPPFAEMR